MTAVAWPTIRQPSTHRRLPIAIRSPRAPSWLRLAGGCLSPAGTIGNGRYLPRRCLPKIVCRSADGRSHSHTTTATRTASRSPRSPASSDAQKPVKAYLSRPRRRPGVRIEPRRRVARRGDASAGEAVARTRNPEVSPKRRDFCHWRRASDGHPMRDPCDRWLSSAAGAWVRWLTLPGLRLRRSRRRGGRSAVEARAVTGVVCARELACSSSHRDCTHTAVLTSTGPGSRRAGRDAAGTRAVLLERPPGHGGAWTKR